MENEYGIGTILNSYTYTLPTGNTISVTTPNDFLASLKAEDQFRKFNPTIIIINNRSNTTYRTQNKIIQ